MSETLQSTAPRSSPVSSSRPLAGVMEQNGHVGGTPASTSPTIWSRTSSLAESWASSVATVNVFPPTVRSRDPRRRPTTQPRGSAHSVGMPSRVSACSTTIGTLGYRAKFLTIASMSAAVIRACPALVL